MHRRSLRFRILILALGLEALTLIVFGAIVRHRSFTHIEKALDEVLSFQTEALAAMIIEGAHELPQIEERMKNLASLLGRRDPDIYEVVRKNGDVILKSPGLGDERVEIPEKVIRTLEPGESQSFDIDWLGEPYRARCLRVVSRFLDLPRRPNTDLDEFYVVYAEELSLFKRRLASLTKYMVMIGAIVLVISAIAMRALAWLGLLPLTRLSHEVASAEPNRPEYRVDIAQLPRDLDALATAINGFLSRVEKAFARERQFSADAAHELCTPIALLKSNVQLALINRAASTEAKQCLQDLLTDIERLERLTDSLLSLSEKEAVAGTRLERRDIRLSPIVEGIVNRFQPIASESGVALELANGNDTSIHADEEALDRVLSNLIDNAIKHNHKGGKVWVSVEDSGGACEIRVADDGPGIPEKDVPNLFERFFRVDKSRSRERGGAGLGLAIAKSLCEAQGATLRYEPRDGGGSIFIVQFSR